MVRGGMARVQQRRKVATGGDRPAAEGDGVTTTRATKRRPSG